MFVSGPIRARCSCFIANNKELGGYQVVEESEKYGTNVRGQVIATLIENPNGLFESEARETLTLGAHIVAAQLVQRVSHKFSGDSLAPGHVEIGVVERLGDSSRE